MAQKIWVRKEVPALQRFLLGLLCVAVIFAVWMVFTTADRPENRLISRGVLPNPLDIIRAFPGLVTGSAGGGWEQSLFYAVWLSLSRELIAFGAVILLALPLGVFMSTSHKVRAFVFPLLTVGTFIPIAALIPLTQAVFGIGELQKVMFLTLGMAFVLLGLVIKEMDEVDKIYLETAYTLGFSQLQTVFLVNFPSAMPRIWKHLSAVFGLGWGYIIFTEMVNSSNGIGWMFIARQRRMQTEDMYAIFFIIIIFAFLFSYLFKALGYLLFPQERRL